MYINKIIPSLSVNVFVRQGNYVGLCMTVRVCGSMESV